MTISVLQAHCSLRPKSHSQIPAFLACSSCSRNTYLNKCINNALQPLTLLIVFGTQYARKDRVQCNPSNTPCLSPNSKLNPVGSRKDGCQERWSTRECQEKYPLWQRSIPSEAAYSSKKCGNKRRFYQMMVEQTQQTTLGARNPRAIKCCLCSQIGCRKSWWRSKQERLGF